MMAFDYSGFGVSTGRSNEETIYENIDAVYRCVVCVLRNRLVFMHLRT